MPNILNELEMKGIIISLLLFVLTVNSYSQTYRQYVKAADKSMSENDYYAAMRYYQDALEIKDTDASLHYKCGNAAREFFAFKIAETHLEKAKKLSEEGEFPLLDFYLAEVKQTLGNYEVAAELYGAYFKAGIGSEMNLEKADMEKDACEWAAQQNPNEEIEIRRLSKKINTKFSEFAGSWLQDTLVFASLKYKDESIPEDRRLSKVIFSTNTETERGKTFKIKGLPENKNIANATFNRAKGTMYFTICDYVNTTDLNCEIYYSIHDGKRWIAEKLPEPINLEGYTSTQPAWSDLEGWKGLFFASDRPKGKGGMDIWFAKHRSGYTFDEPINISSINTPFDEITPSTDNTALNPKLYFSSNGMIGFGNYDVFFSNLETASWASPENMGKPINSGYNDVYFWKDSKMEKAVVSSNRPESESMLKDDPACCNDLYDLKFPEEELLVVNEIPEPIVEPEPSIVPKPKPVPIPEPEVTIPTPKPVIIPTPKPYIKPVPVVTFETILPVKVYFDNDEPDKRTNRTRTIKSYSQSYNEYMKRELVFYDKYVESLAASEKTEALSELTDFFNYDVRKGYSDLNLLASMVLERLINGSNLTVEVKGYTSPRAKTKYNEYLAQRRTSSLLNFFNEYQSGIFQSYLSSGQLKIKELPIGEITAPAGISDVLTDERNSIYSPEASKERRAEVVAVKIN